MICTIIIASILPAGIQRVRQTATGSAPNFNPNAFMNNLPFSNGGPFAPQAATGQQSTTGFTMGGGQQQSGQSNNTGSSNSTQPGTQPFSPQASSGQMSASGYLSGGGSPVGSQSMTGNSPTGGFNPMSGSMSGTGSNPISGFSGPITNPFNTQQSNNSMSTTEFSANGQFDPSKFAAMMGGSGSFNPNQFVGRSKYLRIALDKYASFISKAIHFTRLQKYNISNVFCTGILGYSLNKLVLYRGTVYIRVRSR